MSQSDVDLTTPEVERARSLLRDAGRLVVLTGAGVSAESGVPTFRGDGGLWKQYRAEELATPQAFARDPRLVWEWYGWRRAIVRGCEPNAAHIALATAARARSDVRIVTQNVDGLHVAVSMSESAGTTRFTRPMRYASAASIVSPVRMS